MQVFTDVIQPLSSWIQAHPSFAILITFVISFSESLAIVGSIIPGSVTMTAIGILAGSGLMRVDLTLLSAALGAVAGDFASYMLGYTFRHRIANMWPFVKHPNLLSYGKTYFGKHGGKSVLIGRFIGPLRSIIPLIAGMMHMNRWHFLLANVISAVGWSILYVMPGVFIGTASSDLSAESASRLFLFILLLLVGIWLLSLGIKWIVQRLNRYLRNHLHQIWLSSKQHPIFSRLLAYLTPHLEQYHYETAFFMLSWLLVFTLFVVLTLLIVNSSPYLAYNQAIFYFFQSFRTLYFDKVFIFFSAFNLSIPLVVLSLSMLGYFLLRKPVNGNLRQEIPRWAQNNVLLQNIKLATTWVALIFTTFFIVSGLQLLIAIPPASHIESTYPDLSLTMMASLFSFILFYIRSHCKPGISLLFRIPLLGILLLSGIASVYLGEDWLGTVISSYLLGCTLSLLCWLFLRPHLTLCTLNLVSLSVALLLFIITSILSNFVWYKHLHDLYQPVIKSYVLPEEVWWHQSAPLLPMYSTNRFGKPMGFLNVQYAGDLSFIENALLSSGWQTRSSSYFYSLLIKKNKKNQDIVYPITSQLVLNKKPILIMSYNPGERKPLLILRIWRSNYYLQQGQIIWLGSLQFYPRKKQSFNLYPNIDPFPYLTKSLTNFEINQIHIQQRYQISLPQAVSSKLIFIRPKPFSNGLYY